MHRFCFAGTGMTLVTCLLAGCAHNSNTPAAVNPTGSTISAAANQAQIQQVESNTSASPQVKSAVEAAMAGRKTQSGTPPN